MDNVDLCVDNLKIVAAGGDPIDSQTENGVTVGGFSKEKIVPAVNPMSALAMALSLLLVGVAALAARRRWGFEGIG